MFLCRFLPRILCDHVCIHLSVSSLIFYVRVSVLYEHVHLGVQLRVYVSRMQGSVKFLPVDLSSLFVCTCLPVSIHHLFIREPVYPFICHLCGHPFY